jgi:hypothetical protein
MCSTMLGLFTVPDFPSLSIKQGLRPYYGIRHVWADLDMAHERKAAQLYLPRVTYSIPGAPDTPRREWRVSNGGRRRSSQLLAPYCCTSAPLLGASLAWAAYCRIGRQLGSERPVAT